MFDILKKRERFKWMKGMKKEKKEKKKKEPPSKSIYTGRYQSGRIGLKTKGLILTDNNIELQHVHPIVNAVATKKNQ